jgi:hypothetical protein
MPHRPKIGYVGLAAANSNKDGSGALVTVITAGLWPQSIERVTVQATGPTTAGMIRLFLHEPASPKTGSMGSTSLFDEIPVEAVTPTDSTPPWSAGLDYSGDQTAYLPPGWSLKASTENAERFNVVARVAEITQ